MAIFCIIIGILLLVVEIQIETPTWSYKTEALQQIIGILLMICGVISLKLLSS